MSLIFLFPIVCYFLFLILLITRSGRARTFQEYALAGRSAGGVATAFSYFCTAESVWLLLALTSTGYMMGLQALWIIGGEFFFIAVAWIFLARRIHQLGEKTSARTTIDLIAKLSKDSSGLVKITGTLILALIIPGYVSAQFVALGKIGSLFFGHDAVTSVLFGSVIVLSFSIAASYKSMLSTHIFQGSLRVVVLIMGLVLCLRYRTDYSNVWNEIKNTHLLSLWGEGAFSATHLFALCSFFLVGFDLVAMPQLPVRFIACRDPAEIRKAIPLMLALHLGSCLLAISIGIWGRVLFPGLVDPELILPLIIKTQGGQIIAGLAFACLLAAIMSTVDQLLHTLGTSVAWDVVHSLIDSSLSDKNLIRISRVTVACSGITAVLLSQTDLQVIGLLVRYACSALSAGFGPILILCLFGSRVGPNEAVAGLVFGSVSAIAYGRIFSPAVGVEIAVGIAIGLVAIGIARTRTSLT